MEEENKNSASVLPGEIDDLQDARAPTIAQLLQEKTLYSFSEWPKVRLKGAQFVLKCSWVALAHTAPDLPPAPLHTPLDALAKVLFPRTCTVEMLAPQSSTTLGGLYFNPELSYTGHSFQF